MKLGIFSDPKKFAFSGGYVWVADKNSSKFVSVFKGSIFETTDHSPTVVLKLIYHWACQTNIANVKQWVKVDDKTVNCYYQLFRGICVRKVREEIVNLGGHGKAVEVGVISLGTTSPDGSKREVCILGS